MAGRSLNKVMLIGNLTRDPEMRYTPAGTAVTTFGVATNRSWKTDAGELRDEAEFHRLVAWNKLAELCSQLLAKGKRVYVEGRLQTRTFTGQDSQQHSITEIVLEDMILLDPKRVDAVPGEVVVVAAPAENQTAPVTAPKASVSMDDTKAKKKKQPEQEKEPEVSTEDKLPPMTENVDASDIPF